MSLAAASAELSRLNAELDAHELETKTKIETELDIIATTVAANKAERDVTVAELLRA